MVRVACAFANSNALPITLLAVIHSNFANDDIDQVDPNLFLSVYLIVYPVILWSLGSWLLSDKAFPTTDGALMRHDGHREPSTSAGSIDEHLSGMGHKTLASDIVRGRQCEAKNDEENVSLLERDEANTFDETEKEGSVSVFPLVHPPAITESLIGALLEALHPPAIGALLGIFVASIRPLRSLFVDMYDRNGDAPLQWFFDGVYVVSCSSYSPHRMLVKFSFNVLRIDWTGRRPLEYVYTWRQPIECFSYEKHSFVFNNFSCCGWQNDRDAYYWYFDDSCVKELCVGHTQWYVACIGVWWNRAFSSHVVQLSLLHSRHQLFVLPRLNGCNNHADSQRRHGHGRAHSLFGGGKYK
jgi:hypothetical protein